MREHSEAEEKDLFAIYFSTDERATDTPFQCIKCGSLVAKHLGWEHIVWHSKLETPSYPTI